MLILKKRLPNYKGFTLTEILLVLVIAAAIVISAFIIYPKVKVASDTKTEITNFGYIVATIKQIYGSSAGYGSLNTQILIDSNNVPENMINGSDIINSWSGKYYVSGFDAGMTSNGHVSGGKPMFYVGMANIPFSACVQMVNYYWDTAELIGVSSNKSSFLNNMKKSGEQIKDNQIIISTCTTYRQNGEGVFVSFSFR